MSRTLSIKPKVLYAENVLTHNAVEAGNHTCRAPTRCKEFVKSHVEQQNIKLQHNEKAEHFRERNRS